MKLKNLKKTKIQHVKPLAYTVVSSEISASPDCTKIVQLPECNGKRKIPRCLKKSKEPSS